MEDFEELELNKSYNLIIEDLDMLGRGVSHYKGNTIFIENALTNEKVVAKILNKKGCLYFANTENILENSNLRVKPVCPYFYVCGGCDLQHLNYNETLNFKKKQILINLKKIANLTIVENDIEIVKSDNEYFYRNKVTFQVKNVNNIATLCFYKKQSHNYVEIKNCYICDKKIEKIINLINNFFKENKILAYNKDTKQGLVKNVVVRIIDNKILLTFVTIKKEFPDVTDLFNKLSNDFVEVGINLNINKKDKDILSTNFVELKGKNFIEFNIMNIKQLISNSSFLQVNFNVQDKLYKYVLSKVKGDVVNAYSGAGLLTCLVAKNLPKNKVIGVEINKDATNFADKLTKLNNITNVKNICSDACLELKKLKNNNFTLIVDPPRSGLSDEFVKMLIENPQEKIIYISCSPQTLCKNILKLKDVYEIEEIKAFDMFPQTKNVETVVLLRKK